MKNFYLIFVFIGFMINLQAQEFTESQKQQNFKNFVSADYSGPIYTYNDSYEGVKGTPFVFEEWLKGIVLLKDSTLFKGLSLKYDAYNDELVILNTKNNTPMVMDKTPISAFTLATSELTPSMLFVKVPYDEKNFFMQLIYEGKRIDFLKQYKKRLRKADYEGPYNAGIPYDEFIEGNNYFLRFPTGKMEKTKLNRRSIIKSFPNKQQELKSFAKKNNMNLDNEQDVIKLIKYYITP